ncbi:DUF72 domain-containing protein [Pedobacter sp. NJ-S-72]
MEFGKVNSENVKDVDFTLPEDGVQTQKVLNRTSKGKAKVFIGCAKWGRKEWVGLIYPPKTKEADFLDEYVKHFNSIELNAVYYQIRFPLLNLYVNGESKPLTTQLENFCFVLNFQKLSAMIKG